MKEFEMIGERNFNLQNRKQTKAICFGLSDAKLDSFVATKTREFD